MDQPDVRTLVNQFVVTSDDDSGRYTVYSSKIADLIADSDVSLLQFIQSLGPQLTSDDDFSRAKAAHCLSDTLAQLNNRKLSRQDLCVLLDFFLSKLDDKPCVVHILQGLQSLVAFKTFNPSINDNFVKIVQYLSSSYDPSRFLAKVRYESFKLLEKLLELFLDAISANRIFYECFVKAFINVSTAEKDPRNLILSFSLNRKINQHLSFDITNETEKNFINELFDNCFCYFPISFTPPANDPYKITADQLKSELRLALTSQNLFAKDLFHNLFEKLTSTNPLVRNDVLKTLLLAIKTFDHDTILEFWEYLWNGLKYEILHNENLKIFKPNGNSIIPSEYNSTGDEDEYKVVYLTLAILNEMTIKLKDDDVFFDFILQDLEDNLNTKNKFFNQCVILLSDIASNSVDIFNKVHGHIFKYKYFGKFIGVENTENDLIDEDDLSLPVAKQRDLIDNLGFILISYQVLSAKVDENSEFFTRNKLIEVKDNLIIFLGQLLQSSSNIEKTLKCKIIQQYVKLIQLVKFLNQEEKLLVVGVLNDMFMEILKSDDFSNDLIGNEVLAGIIDILNLKSDQLNRLVVENFLPNLLDEIHPENPNIEQILDIFEKIIVNYELLEILSIRLVNKLTGDVKFNAKIQGLIIKLILKNEHDQQFLMNSWYKSFLPNLFRNITQDAETIEVMGELVGFIVKYNDVSKHQGILNQFLEVFYFAKKDMHLEGYEVLEKEQSVIGILNKVISNIDKSCTLEILQNHQKTQFQLVEVLLSLISDINVDYIRINYLQHLALIVNKFFGTGDDDKQFLDSTLAKLNHPEDLQQFDLFIWVLKALVLRLDPIGIKYFKQCLSYLQDKNTKGVYLRALTILLKDLKVFENSKELKKGDKLVSKVNNLNVRLLYKQQMFNIILNEIIANYESDSTVYLNLLSILLGNVNEGIIKTRINEIIPLIIESLKLSSQSLVTSSLKTLVVITESNDMLNYLPFLIKKLLQLSAPEKTNAEETRYLSLKCLGNLIEQNSKESIMPYKTDLLNRLSAGLDDKKRVIRKLTCDIRQVLYELR